MAFDRVVDGSELVLIAQVPKAGDRWKQVHFNADLVDQFFALGPGHQAVRLQKVDAKGRALEPVTRALVLSEVNKNPKFELDFGKVAEYPQTGPPLVLLLEVDLRNYRYVTLLPGEPGYDEMADLLASLSSIGRGVHRSTTTLDEIELRWPECPLRNPKAHGPAS